MADTSGPNDSGIPRRTARERRAAVLLNLGGVPGLTVIAGMLVLPPALHRPDHGVHNVAFSYLMLVSIFCMGSGVLVTKTCACCNLTGGFRRMAWGASGMLFATFAMFLSKQF